MSWLEETHGVQFELVRHFLRRMFDGEWSSMPGQWRSAAIGAFSLFLPAGILLVREGALDPKYASKYRLLAVAAGPAGLRAAAIADELALVTLLICVTGLMALLEWQSLFPAGAITWRSHLCPCDPDRFSPPGSCPYCFFPRP